jgi:thymidylate synthase (FAD)
MKAEYLNHMGNDLEVVDAARVSFAKSSNWNPDMEEPPLLKSDAKLISYLAKHDHWTPFAHTAIKLRMQAPVPIRTQCFKHKQGLVENEESRRYISSEPTLFMPDVFRSAPVGSIKQGSGGEHYDSQYFRSKYQTYATGCIRIYGEMVRAGVCPEQARFILPQGCEVQWIWTGNLYAFANFYLKRTDPHAQKEIQDLARMVGDIIEPLFPVSWKALTQKDG